MQMCPWCDKVYDESEYSHCPYCSGELEDEDDEVRPCPECGGCLHWDGEVWECSNCDYSEEDQAISKKNSNNFNSKFFEFFFTF